MDANVEYPDALSSSNTGQYEAAMASIIRECGLFVDDSELLYTMHRIGTHEPFLLFGQWLMATAQRPDGTYIAISVDRSGDRVDLRRWELPVEFIYAVLCEDGFQFPWRPGAPPSNGHVPAMLRPMAA
jgi:hypothetical protein